MNDYKMNIYKDKELRRNNSINKLKELSIDYIYALPFTYEASEVKMKSLNEIIGRYIANIIAIQIAFDRLNGCDMEDSLAFFNNLIDNYGVRYYLNDIEKKNFNNELTEQELINLTWQYESLNVLAWVLGFKEVLEYPSSVCDSQYLMNIIACCTCYDEFKDKCNLINIEDILDELYLEYIYHWAARNKKIDPSTKTNCLNLEVVVERRRALEWLFSNEKDWNEILLST